jgi:hypothetical protein
MCFGNASSATTSVLKLFVFILLYPLLYSQTLAKEFDVIRLLTSWHEFNNLETAKAYCKRELKHCNYKDIIIVFDTGVLILG